jgi:hypothetical protein
MTSNPRNLCADCDTDTTPCIGRRGCRHAGKWEWYMIWASVWEAAGMDGGFLCIGCLEHRLGRTLKRRDFAAVPVNGPKSWDTPRLAARKAS